jgi:hypothetical protein
MGPSQRGPGRPPNNGIRASPRNNKSRPKGKGKAKAQSTGNPHRERGSRPEVGCCCVCRGKDVEKENPMLKCAGVYSFAKHFALYCYIAIRCCC